MKPRIHLRFGIWSCVTARPFVCGCGYTPVGAFEEWRRILEEKLAEEPLPVKQILSPIVLCELAAEEVE